MTSQSTTLSSQDLRGINLIFRDYWRDIYSQAYTEMKLQETHYFRRRVKDGIYVCFGSDAGFHFVPADEIYGRKIHCYHCQVEKNKFTEFIMKDPSFPAILDCEDCKGKSHGHSRS